MITRTMADELVETLTTYPSVTLTGPRQAGKTTLAKWCCPGFSYASLEETAYLPRSPKNARRLREAVDPLRPGNGCEHELPEMVTVHGVLEPPKLKSGETGIRMRSGRTIKTR